MPRRKSKVKRSSFDDLPSYNNETSGPQFTAPTELVQLFQDNPLRFSMDRLPTPTEQKEPDQTAPEETENRGRKRRTRKEHDKWLCYISECLYHGSSLEEVEWHWQEHHTEAGLFEKRRCHRVSEVTANAPILEKLELEQENFRAIQEREDGEADDEAAVSQLFLCGNPNCQRLVDPVKLETERKHHTLSGTQVCAACQSYWYQHRNWRPKDLCDVSKIRQFLETGKGSGPKPRCSKSSLQQARPSMTSQQIKKPCSPKRLVTRAGHVYTPGKRAKVTADENGNGNDNSDSNKMSPPVKRRKRAHVK